MKLIFLSAVAGLLRPAVACSPAPTYPFSCPTKTFVNVLAKVRTHLKLQTNALIRLQPKFDALIANEQVPSPYKYLTWANATVISPIRNLPPASSPHYTLSGPYPDSDVIGPFISIDNTKSTSFDLNSVYVGCVTLSGHTPISCRPYIQCATPTNMDGNEGPLQPIYTANGNGSTSSSLLNVNVGFTYLTYCEFRVVESAVALADTLLVTDSFNFTVRQGETLVNN